MGGKTISSLASDLSFIDSKPLSRALKDFVGSRGISKEDFVNLDRETITGLATAFTKRVGRRLWGVTGKFPSFPEHETFIVSTVADVLITQQRYTVDSLRARERRRESTPSEEVGESSEEDETEEEIGRGGDGESEDIFQAERLVARAPAVMTSSLLAAQGKTTLPPSGETIEVLTDKRSISSYDPRLTNQIGGQGTSSRPGITSLYGTYSAASEPERSSRTDIMLRSHKRDHNAMESAFASTEAAGPSTVAAAEPAPKHRRIILNLPGSMSQAAGSPSVPGGAFASAEVSKPAAASTFSGVKNVFSYEPATAKRCEPSKRVSMTEKTTQTEDELGSKHQTAEIATQTDERLSFEYGFTWHSLERSKLEPLVLRILSRCNTGDFKVRSRAGRAGSENRGHQDQHRPDSVKLFRSVIWRDLVSLGVLAED